MSLRENQLQLRQPFESGEEGMRLNAKRETNGEKIGEESDSIRDAKKKKTRETGNGDSRKERIEHVVMRNVLI